MTIFNILLFIFFSLVLFLILTRKFVDPYKLIFLFGKKGSGKSTLLQKLTYRYLKRGWTVYSTEVALADPELNDSDAELNDDLEDEDLLYPYCNMSCSLDEERLSKEGGAGTASCRTKTRPPGRSRHHADEEDDGRTESPRPGSSVHHADETDDGRKKRFRRRRSGLSVPHYIDPTKIFEYTFPEKSCILIDEVSLIWDNRDFKKMDKRVVEWFRYQRHHQCRVYFFSQTFDIDKKLRDLCDDMYLVNKYFRVLVVASHIVRKPVVVHPGPESPARIDDDMIVDGPLLTFFGGKLFAFIPYWARKFDSYTTDYKRKEESGAP